MINLELLYKSVTIDRNRAEGRLVIVSNRVPAAASPAAGGLVVALEAALRKKGGLWFGWSGRTSEREGPAVKYGGEGLLSYAVCDLPRRDIEDYYYGFANQALWPICHYRLDLANLSENYVTAYFRVNEQFARKLHPLLTLGDRIWVHDYHLIPLARFLRQLGCTNRIGFFLHIPWPGPDVAKALPSYQRLLRSFGAYDLIGFQTEADADNFRDCLVAANAGRSGHGNRCEIDGRVTQVDTFPIGIDTEAFARAAQAADKNATVKRMLASLDGRPLLIGVDRLDYSKGLRQRLEAFGTFLDCTPEAARAHVTFLQITPKSRSEVPEYAQMQRELAEEAGRINGKYGDVDWTPLRYLNKTLGHSTLAGLYRLSCIGLVTPLRDGMNLVAKEYVAAQAPDNPGALVLSQFAGAAEELDSALIVNPYDIEGTAAAIAQAFFMPLIERKERYRAMMAALRANSVHDWAARFLQSLTHLPGPADGEKDIPDDPPSGEAMRLNFDGQTRDPDWVEERFPRKKKSGQERPMTRHRLV